jgi:quinoprotein glucose dehydrogenase
MEYDSARGAGVAVHACRECATNNPAGEWRRAGADTANTRYSPLDQINATNVRNLKIAWVWRSDNFGSQPEIKNETTPVMINGVLYFTAGDRRSVVAADPSTGETLWVWRLDEGRVPTVFGRIAAASRTGRWSTVANFHRHARLSTRSA